MADHDQFDQVRTNRGRFQINACVYRIEWYIKFGRSSLADGGGGGVLRILLWAK